MCIRDSSRGFFFRSTSRCSNEISRSSNAIHGRCAKGHTPEFHSTTFGESPCVVMHTTQNMSADTIDLALAIATPRLDGYKLEDLLHLRLQLYMTL